MINLYEVGEIMKNKIRASIIIPTKDKITRLRLVLKALEKQVDDSIEVIVVFDGNSSQTIEAFYKLNFTYQPQIILIEKNMGRSAARNIGINQAKGEVIILMDDDVIPSKDFIAKHLAGHTQRCVLMGATRDTFLSETEIEQLDLDERIIKNDLTLLNEISHFIRKPIFINTLFKLFGNGFPLKWLLVFTNNLSLNRKDLLEVGGFNENFKGWGHEDIELGYRLHKHGLRFKKDFSIVNYHLVHGNNDYQRLNDSILNLKHFLKEHRGIIAQAWIRLLILKENVRKLLQVLHQGKIISNKNWRY